MKILATAGSHNVFFLSYTFECLRSGNECLRNWSLGSNKSYLTISKDILNKMKSASDVKTQTINLNSAIIHELVSSSIRKRSSWNTAQKLCSLIF